MKTLQKIVKHEIRDKFTKLDLVETPYFSNHLKKFNYHFPNHYKPLFYYVVVPIELTMFTFTTYIQNMIANAKIVKDENTKQV